MSIKKVTLALLPLVGAATALGNSTIAYAPIHIFIARGSTESYPGSLGDLVETIIKNKSGIIVNYGNIVYPAVDETTSDSYFVGRKAVAEQATSYVDRCRGMDGRMDGRRIVVLEYSQGALIISYALSGGDSIYNSNSTILGNLTQPGISPTHIGGHINAIALFGDPRHMAYQQYNRGTPGNESTFGVSGKYPRTEFQLDYLNAHYASKLRDYCNPGDHFCAQGDDIVVHVDEVPDLSAAAAEWIQAKLE